MTQGALCVHSPTVTGVRSINLIDVTRQRGQLLLSRTKEANKDSKSTSEENVPDSEIKVQAILCKKGQDVCVYVSEKKNHTLHIEKYVWQSAVKNSKSSVHPVHFHCITNHSLVATSSFQLKHRETSRVNPCKLEVTAELLRVLQTAKSSSVVFAAVSAGKLFTWCSMQHLITRTSSFKLPLHM